MLRKFMRCVSFADFMDALAIAAGVGSLFIAAVLFGL